MRSIFFVPVLAIFFLSSCARNPVTGKREFMLVSKGQEVQMGVQADPEITAFFGLYDDPELQRFIEEKGTQMAQISHRSDLEYHFKIVDSPVVNAFAVPGGFIYFTRGIMAHFNNEAEFAGVLGHEIGHVAARHSAKQYSNAMIAQLGLAVGTVVSPEFAQFANLVSAGVGLLFLKYGRDAERQSDKLGVEYSTKIGYDAMQMADFFNTLDRMREESGQDVPGFLSTHPHPAERYETVRKLAVNWQKKTNATNPQVNRDEYLRMIDGIVYGEDPRQGFVENNMFYHPELRFSYPVPQGWLLQNTPQQVQMAPQDGSAMMMLTLVQAADLETAANQTLQNYNLTLVESQPLNLNEFKALGMVAEQAVQGQTPLRLLIYLIQDQDKIYNFLGVTQSSAFDNYLQTFRGTMNNFRRLNDPDKLNRKADRIRIATVRSTGPLSRILKENGAADEDIEELAILNGMDLNETVQSGSLIKLIEKQR